METLVDLAREPRADPGASRRARPFRPVGSWSGSRIASSGLASARDRPRGSRRVETRAPADHAAAGDTRSRNGCASSRMCCSTKTLPIRVGSRADPAGREIDLFESLASPTCGCAIRGLEDLRRDANWRAASTTTSAGGYENRLRAAGASSFSLSEPGEHYWSASPHAREIVLSRNALDLEASIVGALRQTSSKTTMDPTVSVGPGSRSLELDRSGACSSPSWSASSESARERAPSPRLGGVVSMEGVAACCRRPPSASAWRPEPGRRS